ncbi:MAG TPA: hypothetical protein VF575_03065 [Candidatus Saccharimonadales bacterium]|jgi:hypothetical protein
MAKILPLTTMIVSPSDLKRARRELEALDDFMHQASLRQGGKALKMPQTSRLIDELASETNVNMLQSADRAKLLKYLTDLITSAPVLHFSFASEPSASFMNKLIIWLRSNIHPQVLVHLGLQPSIAAGCIVRTSNKQFDFSLTQAFERQRELLVSSLREYSQPSTQLQPAGVVPAPQAVAPAATSTEVMIDENGTVRSAPAAKPVAPTKQTAGKSQA